MDAKELKRQMVQAIYQAWDHYPDKKQHMGSPEASRIADAILSRFHVAETPDAYRPSRT